MRVSLGSGSDSVTRVWTRDEVGGEGAGQWSLLKFLVFVLGTDEIQEARNTVLEPTL